MQALAGVHVNSSAGQELFQQLACCCCSTLLYDLVVGPPQQQQQQDHQQQQQQQPQVWSLMVSLLKGYRVRAPVTFSGGSVLNRIMWAASDACTSAPPPLSELKQALQQQQQAVQQQQQQQQQLDTHGAASVPCKDPRLVEAEWHANLAPWFVLLGRCLLTCANCL
jgi:hypothetical protein